MCYWLQKKRLANAIFKQWRNKKQWRLWQMTIANKKAQLLEEAKLEEEEYTRKKKV